MRYAGPDNFMGRPAAGYEAPACILTRPAAAALARAQAQLDSAALTLVVFDCYRPNRAVDDFAAWVDRGGSIDRQWAPRVKRRALIAEGYIGRRSAHSRGSTVDLAIAPKGHGSAASEPDCGARGTGILDFGSGFDCFDAVSATAHAPLDGEAAANRRRLVSLMQAAGFRNYAGEWWHFTLVAEPFPRQRFDFPVTAGP